MKRNIKGSMGAVSILMVFTVLCLATFSILTLSTARMDMRMTDKNAQSVHGIYAAKGESQRFLMETDTAVKAAKAGTLTNDDAISQIALLCKEFKQTDGAGALVAVYETPATDALTLHVEVLLDFESGAATVQTQALIPSEQWQEDVEMSVWQG